MSPPRTKKTHNRVVFFPVKGSRRCGTCGHIKSSPRVLPSEQYELWENYALQQCFRIKAQLSKRGVELPITGMVSIEAQIFRDRATGDAAGYYQAIGDMLQKAEILKNDAQIEDWDGSRRLKDAARPRVEIYITILDPLQSDLDL